MRTYRWKCLKCGAQWDSTQREGDRCACKHPGVRVWSVAIHYHPTKGAK